MRVLIIEAKTKTVSSIAASLERQEVVVLGYSERTDWEVVAQEWRPDVIVVDITMTGMKGLDTIYRMRKTLPEATILATGLGNSKSCRVSPLEVGAHEYIVNSELHTKLLPAIRRALESRG
jgi:DNA-binding response OmpR family regulator